MNTVGTQTTGGNGSINGIFVRIVRFGITGWIVALIFFLALLLTIGLYSIKKPEVMIVDKQGNFLGYVNFQNSLARTDTELLNAAKKYSSCQWSLNSATVIDDAACVIKMSDTKPYGHKEPMQDRYIENLEKSNYIELVKQSNNRSNVQFYDDQIMLIGERFAQQLVIDGVPVVENGTPVEHYYQRVVIAGDINVLGTKNNIKSFRQELILRIVPRTSFDHLGVVISDENNI